MNEIGLLIYNRRKELGLTLEEIGNFVGVSKSTVKKWECGAIMNMKRDKIAALAKILHINPVDLVPSINPDSSILDYATLLSDKKISSLINYSSHLKSSDLDILLKMAERMSSYENGEKE